MKSDMQSIIMRRVYYSYGLSIISHSMFWQGVFLPVAGFFLAKWLHVASIVHNLLSVPVGGAPRFVWNSFVEAATHGELVTVVTFVVAGVVTVSAGYHLMQAMTSRMLLPKVA